MPVSVRLQQRQRDILPELVLGLRRQHRETWNSHVLVEEVKQRAVRLLVVSLDGTVFQVTSGSHKTMDLIWVPFNNILDIGRYSSMPSRSKSRGQRISWTMS